MNRSQLKVGGVKTLSSWTLFGATILSSFPDTKATNAAQVQSFAKSVIASDLGKHRAWR